MTKEEEIMAFLNERVFEPILRSKVPEKVKRGTRVTRSRMEALSAKSMIAFYWHSIVGTERSMDFAAELKKAGVDRFEEVIDDFRDKFSDEWIRKK